MAVQPQTPYKEYTANGITNSFALEFDCENQDHLIVLVDEVEPVVGAWSLSGGAVVFSTAPTTGKRITIQRNTPFRRDGDFQSYDNSFRPGPVNKGFDWVWLKLQELGVADWILSNRIDALKNYVDDRDDELRAYLMEEIRKQGVALDQLDEYYNYLMQRLAQIAVDKGWDASFVVDASGNTQQQINDRTVHVERFRYLNGVAKTDQQAIQDAVNYCVENNRTLNWDGANLTSTDNIVNIWKVTHIGNGSITRSENIFYLENKDKVSHFFVNISANSNISNDGLSADFPIYPAMINTIFDKFIVLNGDYVFNFAPLNFNDGSAHRILLGGNTTTEKLLPQNSGLIIFKGADVRFDAATNAVPTPLTKFGSTSGNQSAIAFNLKGFRALVKDIQFSGYIGTSSSGGVAMTNGQLYCQNVHGYRNYYDISALQFTYVSVIGGILDGGSVRSGIGIRSIFNSKHDIGSQLNTAQQTPIIKNKATGFIAQEGSTGHSDYVTYDNCSIGVQAVVNSRINTNGSKFTNTSLGINARDGGCVFLPSNVIFINCSENVSCERGDLITDNVFYNNSKYESLIYSTVTQLTTSGTVLMSACEIQIPTYWSTVGLLGVTNVGKKLRFVISGFMSGTSGTKQIRLQASDLPNVINGSYIVNVTSDADAFGYFKSEVTLNFAPEEYVSTADIITVSGANKFKMNLSRASTINFSKRVNLALLAGVANSLDSIRIDKVDVYAVV